ncbi:MAG: hypothetical protein FWF26_00905 [Treponema sp.]|nr:hypothetical protein [Treponema sp.]
MTAATTSTNQYLTRFGDHTIAGSQYALKKLGVDRSNCSLKIEEYIILCVPFQLGFRRSILLASLSKQELAFFQKYANSSVGLSIALNPNNRPEPIKFFLRCTLSTLGQMKGRENVGLFVVDYKILPDEMITMLGHYLENQERIKTQYEDYGKTPVKMTAENARIMGYNMYATITEANVPPRRIQVFSLNSKSLEHMEAAGAPIRKPGKNVTYQLFFQKYRIAVAGIITGAGPLPQGIIRTIANIEFCPELVEILDDYWYGLRTNSTLIPLHRIIH